MPALESKIERLSKALLEAEVSAATVEDLQRELEVALKRVSTLAEEVEALQAESLAVPSSRELGLPFNIDEITLLLLLLLLRACIGETREVVGRDDDPPPQRGPCRVHDDGAAVDSAPHNCGCC